MLCSLWRNLPAPGTRTVRSSERSRLRFGAMLPAAMSSPLSGWMTREHRPAQSVRMRSVCEDSEAAPPPLRVPSCLLVYTSQRSYFAGIASRAPGSQARNSNTAHFHRRAPSQPPIAEPRHQRLPPYHRPAPRPSPGAATTIRAPPRYSANFCGNCAMIPAERRSDKPIR